MNSKPPYGMRNDKSKNVNSNQSTTLTAVALQDHLIRSLSLGNPLRPQRPALGHKPRKKPVEAVVDTGRNRTLRKAASDKVENKEYVLDPKPASLTLAQKFGLVDAPAQPLTEAEWGQVKERSNRREDSKQPCVICKEDFGTQEQVLLSCTHVFHKVCLQAFERFTGKKTCPMCRKEQYQTRVIHEGSRQYRQRCATRIQATWRGHVVRSWYQKLRETIPPKDERLRKKFYEERLRKITDRMVRSLDFDVNSFLSGIDRDLEASRDVFRHFDDVMKVITEDEWERIQLKAVERNNSDCPICLTALADKGLIVSANQLQKPEPDPKNAKTSLQKSQQRSSVSSAKKLASHQKTVPKVKESAKVKEAPRMNRETVLLSCSHVFHNTCLGAFEEFAVGERQHACPVCRSPYQKRVL